VRELRETVSFPYRHDNDKQCVYLRSVVSLVSSGVVEFSNRVVSTEVRPWNSRVEREYVTENWDCLICSVCSRLQSDDDWYEFQYLCSGGALKAREGKLRCRKSLCSDCECAIVQRMGEARRALRRRVA